MSTGKFCLCGSGVTAIGVSRRSHRGDTAPTGDDAIVVGTML
jgi:hypothetical protein